MGQISNPVKAKSASTKSCTPSTHVQRIGRPVRFQSFQKRQNFVAIKLAHQRQVDLHHLRVAEIGVGRFGRNVV